MNREGCKKYFNMGKESFLKKNGYFESKKPENSAYHYLTDLNEDDVYFSVNEVSIFSAWFEYGVAAKYYCTSENMTSSGSCNNYASNTNWVYVSTNASNIPIYIKKIYGIDSCKIYDPNYIRDAIISDAKWKLPSHFKKTGANVCYESGVTITNINYVNTHMNEKPSKHFFWGYIYSNREIRHMPNKIIGYVYSSSSTIYYSFFKQKRTLFEIFFGLHRSTPKPKKGENMKINVSKKNKKRSLK